MVRVSTNNSNANFGTSPHVPRHGKSINSVYFKLLCHPDLPWRRRIAIIEIFLPYSVPHRTYTTLCFCVQQTTERNIYIFEAQFFAAINRKFSHSQSLLQSFIEKNLSEFADCYASSF